MRAAAMFFVAAFCSTMVPAQAASTFEIAPTTLNLSPGEAGLLYVSNNGTAPVVMQIQPMDWTQNANTDVLEPSETLFASPPLLRIAPGQRQVVRVLSDPQIAAHETDYRLLVSELPQNIGAPSTVNVLLQFNIPVFVAAKPEKAVVTWSAVLRDGQVHLALRNGGTVALKLGDISVAKSTGAFASISTKLVYLLPGTQREWSVADDGASFLRVSAREERSDVLLDADIPVQR
jgi:fimbrial chaperone protein